MVLHRSASLDRAKPQRSRRLRRDSTDAEQCFWNAVRNRAVAGVKFRRQWPIGPFVADFCCPERGLVLEIDGGQHFESSSDEKRTLLLQERGFRVIRFWNNDILANIEGVIERLRELIENDPSPPRFARTLAPEGEREK